MKTYDIILSLQEAFELANEAGSGTWVQLAPYGQWDNAHGMQEVRKEDAETIVRNFADERPALREIGLPFYIGHPDHPSFTDRYKDTKAYGRIRSVQAREDGLYAEVFFNEAGRELVAQKAFHGHSVNWSVVPDGRKSRTYHPVRLKSVGFTNEPQIPVEPIAIANEAIEKQHNQMDKKQLCNALGLKDDASDEDIMNAISGMKETANQQAKSIEDFTKKLAEKEAVQAANEKAKTELAERDNKIVSLTADVDTHKGLASAETAKFANERKAHAETMVNLAIQTGRITKADEEAWKKDLANEFDTKVKELMAKEPKFSAGLDLNRKKQGHSNSEQRQSQFLELVNERMKTTGEDYSLAFFKVQQQNPGFFQTAGK